MYLEGKKIMPPPWLAYPHIERGSIGWRTLSDIPVTDVPFPVHGKTTCTSPIPLHTKKETVFMLDIQYNMRL